MNKKRFGSLPFLPRYTIQDMREIANVRGGKCLSPEYKGLYTALSWQCSEGHTWESSPKSVFMGSWCPQCVCLKSRLPVIDYKNLDIRPFRESHLKEFQELRDIFNKEDPMGFFRIKGIMPANEYDPEIATVLMQIDEARDVNGMHELIYCEFSNWFDKKVIGSKEKYYTLACKVFKWHSDKNKSGNMK